MKIKLLDSNIKAPTRAYKDDAGLDFYLPKDIEVKPLCTEVVDTGVCVQLPKGYAGMFVIRSSVSKKSLVIQPPLVDSGYTGELHIMVSNIGHKTFTAKKDDRLCSLVIFPIFSEEIEIVNKLDSSERGEKWSGSSGK